MPYSQRSQVVPGRPAWYRQKGPVCTCSCVLPSVPRIRSKPFYSYVSLTRRWSFNIGCQLGPKPSVDSANGQPEDYTKQGRSLNLKGLVRSVPDGKCEVRKNQILRGTRQPEHVTSNRSLRGCLTLVIAVTASTPTEIPNKTPTLRLDFSLAQMPSRLPFLI